MLGYCPKCKKEQQVRRVTTVKVQEKNEWWSYRLVECCMCDALFRQELDTGGMH